MKKFIFFFISVIVFLVPLFASSSDSNRKISIPVSVPGGELTQEALDEIREGCRKAATGERALAMKHFMHAIPGVQSTSLSEDLRRGKTELDANRKEGDGESSGGLRFFQMREDTDAKGLCMLYLPGVTEKSWLEPYLKDPRWMREDLPEKIRALSAEVTDLPSIQPANLVASSRPGDLSGWVSQREGRGKVIVFLNLIHEYCRQFLKSESNRVLTPGWKKNVDERALEWLVSMHRMGHGMGPLAVRVGDTSKVVAVDVALGESHLLLEEIKADALSVLSGLRHAENDKAFAIPSSHLVATYTIYLLARAFPISSPGTKPFRVILLTLLNDGGLRFDLSLRKIVPDAIRMRNSLKSLLQKVVRIQAKGDEAEAVKFIESMEKKSAKADFPDGMRIETRPRIEMVAEIDSGESSE